MPCQLLHCGSGTPEQSRRRLGLDHRPVALRAQPASTTLALQCMQPLSLQVQPSLWSAPPAVGTYFGGVPAAAGLPSRGSTTNIHRS